MARRHKCRVPRWAGNPDDTYIRIFARMQRSVMRNLGGNEIKTYMACLAEAHNPDSRRILWQLLTVDEQLSTAEAQKLMADYRVFVLPAAHVPLYFASASAGNRIYTYMRHLIDVGLVDDVTVPPGTPDDERTRELRRRQAAHLPNIYRLSDRWRGD